MGSNTTQRKAQAVILRAAVADYRDWRLIADCGACGPRSLPMRELPAAASAYFGTTAVLPPGLPGGGMTGVERVPDGAPRLIAESAAGAGGVITPLRAAPPGVSAPDGRGAGVTLCDVPVLPVVAGGGWPG